MPQRAMIANLYRALMIVSTMRDEVTGLPAGTTETFQTRLDAVERTALRLLAQTETAHRPTGH
jgi:hypothetical protein